MQHYLRIPFLDVPLFVLFALAILYLPLTIFYRRYSGVSSGGARALLGLATLGMILGTIFFYGRSPFPPDRDHDAHPGYQILSAALVWVFLLPLLVRLYFKWIGGSLTEAEKSPDMSGIRAWLQGGNVVCALCISVLAAIGFQYSFWGLLALILGALLAYPIMNIITRSAEPSVSAPPMDGNLSNERERVLRMLEAGRISAEECADLLNALGHSAGPPPPPPSRAAGPGRKLVLAGAAMLLVGFFLPWLSFDPGMEFVRLVNAQPAAGSSAFPAAGLTVQVRTSGGQIGHGLGWLVLALGAGVAILPFIVNGIDSETRWKISMLALGIGSIVLIYLLTQNLKYASVGLLVVIAGYALEFIGLVRERPATTG